MHVTLENFWGFGFGGCIIDMNSAARTDRDNRLASLQNNEENRLTAFSLGSYSLEPSPKLVFTPTRMGRLRCCILKPYRDPAAIWQAVVGANIVVLPTTQRRESFNSALSRGIFSIMESQVGFYANEDGPFEVLHPETLPAGATFVVLPLNRQPYYCTPVIVPSCRLMLSLMRSMGQNANRHIADLRCYLVWCLQQLLRESYCPAVGSVGMMEADIIASENQR